MAKSGKNLFNFLVGLVCFVLVVVAVLAIIVNLTPRQLGLANEKLTDTYTVDTLGIADVKIIDVLHLANAITTAQSQDDIAPNAYTPADAVSADLKFASTAIGAVDVLLNGKPQYGKLFVTPLVTTKSITLTDRELAYALDEALQQFYNSDTVEIVADYIEAIDILRKLNASVVDMTFYEKSEKFYLKTVIKLDVSAYTQEINQNIPKRQINDTVYCTLVNQIDVRNANILGIIPVGGVLTRLDFVGVSINNQDEEVSKVALNALFKLTTEDGSEPLTVQKVNSGVLAIISDFCRNIGKIGVKTNSSSTYGTQGIDCENGQITFLP